MYKVYLNLLKEYADSLIKTQFKHKDPAFLGGFLCPSCKNIHGRSIDAIYALAIAYKTFKDDKYLASLKRLFAYSNNLMCLDGGLYNDLQTEWRFTTTFHEIALAETLLSCKEELKDLWSKKLIKRIELHGKWLYENLNEFSKANINYCTTNGLALFLAGKVLNNSDYIKQAYHLVNYALDHISENDLFYGQCQPHNYMTENGCQGIDIGYNLEESLPALAKFAYFSQDEEILNKVYKLGLGHLPFILPDGAIDNSLGCRNYKWTYYGSRTCDGIIPLCLILGEKDKRFIEAANRNLSLISSCSHNGLLYGGPDYFKHHEYPCLHQTFEHINAIAFAIDHYDENYIDINKEILPSEEIFDKYIKEMNSYRLSNDRFILSVSNNDINIPYSGHLSGGSITLLFDKKQNKPMIVGSVGDYKLTEQTNMQVVLDRDNHKPGYPRIDETINNEYYSTGYFTKSNINKNNNNFSFNTKLSTREGKLLDKEYYLDYELKTDGLLIRVSSSSKFVYTLPLINGDIKLKTGKIINRNNTFFLTPGFIMEEIQIESVNNVIELMVINND